MRRFSAVLFVALLSTTMLSAAQAQEPARYPGLGDGDTTPGTPSLPQDIELTVAAGAKIQPEYMGSDDYEAIFNPALKLEYKQKAFLVIDRQAMMVPYEGLGYKLLSAQDFSAGVNLNYERGRDADGFLAGMGDIDWAATGGVFAAYHPGPFFVRGQVGSDLTGEYSGYKGDLGVGVTAPLNPSWRGMIELDTAFSGDGYAEKFFGVSASQSANTGGRLTAFDPDAGFYRAGLTGVLQYQFTQGAFAQGLLRYEQLVGDAADSSVSQDDSQFYMGANVGYHF